MCVEGDLTESTLLDYLKFQCSHQPPFSSSTINDRIAVADRALRNEFPDAPDPMAQGFQQAYLRRGPLGLGRSAGSDEPVASESAQTPTSSRFPWRRWHVFGPASARRGTWPSWA